MQNLLRAARVNKALNISASCLARVVEVDDVQARRLYIDELASEFDVLMQTCNVPLLAVGDLVLVQLASNGAIITHRLRQEHVNDDDNALFD